MDYFESLSEEHQYFLKEHVFPKGKLDLCLLQLKTNSEKDRKFFSYAKYCGESVKETEDPTIDEIVNLIYPFLGLHEERRKLANDLLFAWCLSACFMERGGEYENEREYSRSIDAIKDYEAWKAEMGGDAFKNAGISIYWLTEVHRQGLMSVDLLPYIKVWDSYIDEEEDYEDELFLIPKRRTEVVTRDMPPPKPLETTVNRDDWNESFFQDVAGEYAEILKAADTAFRKKFEKQHSPWSLFIGMPELCPDTVTGIVDDKGEGRKEDMKIMFKGGGYLYWKPYRKVFKRHFPELP